MAEQPPHIATMADKKKTLGGSHVADSSGEPSPVENVPAEDKISSYEQDVAIARDEQFRRYYAERLVAIRRRFDTQLSFIVEGEEPSGFSKKGPSEIKGSSASLNVALMRSANEVVRVHVPNEALFNIFMQILDELLQAKPDRAEYYKAAIDSLIAARLSERSQSVAD